MTDTLTPYLDARHAAEFHDEFSEAEMNAIDRAAVSVWKRFRHALPADYQTAWLDEWAGRGWDPAGAVRAACYFYAATHTSDIHERTPAHIFNHVKTRIQQNIARAITKDPEYPWGSLEDLERYCVEAGYAERLIRKHWKLIDPYASPVMIPVLDGIGQFPAPDQIEFTVKHRRKGKPVFESPEVLAKLHTRKPTRMEFWFEVCDEWDRAGFRKQIAAAFADGICDCDHC